MLVCLQLSAQDLPPREGFFVLGLMAAHAHVESDTSDEETKILKARLEERRRHREAEKAKAVGSDSGSTAPSGTSPGDAVVASPGDSVMGAEKRTKADRERARRERNRAKASDVQLLVFS